MSELGHAICRTCKEEWCLGKWLSKDGVPFGFSDGSGKPSDLGLKTLNFIALHLGHHLQFLSSTEYDELSWTEPLDEYRDVELEVRADWASDAERR